MVLVVLHSTPITDDGALDYESTETLIEHVIGGGVLGIILVGSTGEFFSLSKPHPLTLATQVISAVSAPC
jgi:dihydrodipicolinate synthase/N-acetylneuraminate lyase